LFPSKSFVLIFFLNSSYFFKSIYKIFTNK
jgi:hypothetical protein